MNGKKIIISISLVCLLALSISCTQAASEEDAMQSTNQDMLTSQVTVDGDIDEIADAIERSNDEGADEIADAIERANDGDTVDLGENREYDISNDSISISKNITLKGNNVTITSRSSEGGLILKGNDITIQGITFQNPMGLEENGTLSGKAIYANQICNLVIDGCRFINYEWGIDIHDSNGIAIKNCWFNGISIASEEAEESTSASEEVELGTSVSEMSGTLTKAIQFMNSTDVIIINNTFYGLVKGGLSIVSESGNFYLENNTFINTSWFCSNPDYTFAIFKEIPSELEVFYIYQANLNTTGEISEEVRQLAKEIVGTTKGIEAVKKLAVWVSKNIANEKAAGFYQSPFETLQRKAGNCCCHSELFLQMCASLGYIDEFDMYIVHVGTMEFGKRHFFTVIGNFCVDTTKKNPWGKGGFGSRPIYSITKYPFLPLLRVY